MKHTIIMRKDTNPKYTLRPPLSLPVHSARDKTHSTINMKFPATHHLPYLVSLRFAISYHQQVDRYTLEGEFVVQLHYTLRLSVVYGSSQDGYCVVHMFPLCFSQYTLEPYHSGTEKGRASHKWVETKLETIQLWGGSITVFRRRQLGSGSRMPRPDESHVNYLSLYDIGKFAAPKYSLASLRWFLFVFVLLLLSLLFLLGLG